MGPGAGGWGGSLYMRKVGKTNERTSGSLEEYVKPPDQTLRKKTACLKTVGNCSVQLYV